MDSTIYQLPHGYVIGRSRKWRVVSHIYCFFQRRINESPFLSNHSYVTDRYTCPRIRTVIYSIWIWPHFWAIWMLSVRCDVSSLFLICSPFVNCWLDQEMITNNEFVFYGNKFWSSDSVWLPLVIGNLLHPLQTEQLYCCILIQLPPSSWIPQ